MNSQAKLKYLTVVTLCLFIFLGSYGIDLTLEPPGYERYPYHRFLIVITALIALLNIREVVNLCLSNKALILLVAYIFATSLWSDDPQGTMKNFVFLASAVFIAILIVNAFSERNIVLVRWLFWLFLLMNLASIYVALEYPALGINVKEFGKPRWLGITNHPNTLGATGLILIWLASNLYFLTRKTFEKLCVMIAIGVGLWVIVKADSITSLVDAFLVIELVCYYYLFNKLSLPVKVCLLGAGFFASLFLALFFFKGQDMASVILSSAGRNTNLSGRTLLWSKAFTAFFESPIIGYGFDDLAGLTKRFRLLMSHLHNGYLEVLVKGGLIAGLLTFVILFRAFVDQLLIKSSHRNNFILLNSGLVMVLVHNFTESTLMKGLNPLNIVSIYVVVATSYFRNKKAMVNEVHVG